MPVMPVLLDYVAAQGHAVFTAGEYNLNIIGIRTPDDTANTFNDRLCVVYRDEFGWVTRGPWPITTDPGLYWRKHPMRVSGTAILCPQQARGAYKIGTHRTYAALVQRGRVKIWRDNNRDEVLDTDPSVDTDSGHYGINIHRATSRRDGATGGGSTLVDRFSAGCQVFADPDDYDVFMGLCRKQVEVNGWETFTYTLVDASVY